MHREAYSELPLAKSTQRRLWISAPITNSQPSWVISNRPRPRLLGLDRRIKLSWKQGQHMQANQSDGPNCGIALLNSVIVMHTQRKLSPPLERRLSACAQPMPCHVCPFRYIWFSQASTGEKNLASGYPPSDHALGLHQLLLRPLAISIVRMHQRTWLRPLRRPLTRLCRFLRFQPDLGVARNPHLPLIGPRPPHGAAKCAIHPLS